MTDPRNIRSPWTTPALIVFGAWSIFVFIVYGRVWVSSFEGSEKLLEIFLRGGWIYYAHLLGFVLLFAFLERKVISPKHRSICLLVFFGISFLFLILLGGNKKISLSILFCVLWMIVSGLGAKGLLEKWFAMEIPFFAGLLVVFIFVETILFAAGLLGVASYGLKLIMALTIPLAALLLNFGILAKFIRKKISFLISCSSTSWLFIEGIFLVFCLGFLQASLPEVLVDADALHIPKAMKISNSPGLNVLMDFPYYIYGMILSSVHILFSFFYTFAGEYGIKSLTWMMIPVMAGIVLDICKSLDMKQPQSLGAVVVFLFIPAFIWHYGCGYIDMVANIFGLAGVALLLRGVKDDRKQHSCYLFSGIFFGAAVSSKITLSVFVFVFVFLAGIAAVFKNKNFHLQGFTKFIFPMGLGISLLAFPYLIYHYVVLGNPFFPALGNIFPSPFLKSLVNMQGYQSFASISGWDWLVFPYTLVMHTSLFGSKVEYVDGSIGVWFLLLSPFLALAIKNGFRDRCFILSLLGSAGFIFILSLLGTHYVRYYIPSIAILICLIAKGIPFKASTFSISNGGVWAPLIILVLSFPVLTFRTVWSPTINHWQHFRAGSEIDWLESHQPGYKGLKNFLDRLSDEVNVFSYRAFGLSHFAVNSVFLRDIDIIFSEKLKLNLSTKDTEILKNDFWKFFNKFKKGEMNNPFNQRDVDEIIAGHGDILIFNYLNDMQTQSKSRFTSIERLLYTSSNIPGAFSKFTLAFGVNDRLFPADRGIKIKIAPPEQETGSLMDTPSVWRFSTLKGEVEIRQGETDVWASNERYLLKTVQIPPTVSKVKMILPLRYGEIPDYYPGVQLNWLGENRDLIKITPLGIFYSNQEAIVFAIEKIPENADKITVIIRPNKERALAVGKGELLFISHPDNP